jgi:solute carrier family 25 (mitochondrial carrier protein), member 16
VIAPLDRIKILFQTANPEFKKYTGSIKGMGRGLVKIWQTSGVYGLFQGHSATLVRIFPYAAIKFVAYDEIRDHLIPTQAEEVWYRRISAGSLAGTFPPFSRVLSGTDAFVPRLGLTSVFFTYPLEVVRVRLAFETQTSQRIKLREICSKIYHERDFPLHKPAAPHTPSTQHAHLPLFGLTNFYRGFMPTMAGMIPYAGISFWARDAARDVLRSGPLAPWTLADVPARNEREKRSPKLRNGWEAVAGGIAGLLAQTSSYPFEVVRRRMQVGGAVGNHEMKKFMEVVRDIYSTAGIRGFYIGLSIGYIKVYH